MFEPSFEFVASFFGAIKRGAVAVPCSSLFGPDALRYRVTDSEATALMTPAENVDMADDLVGTTLTSDDLQYAYDTLSSSYEAETCDEDLCWIQYTSGTTGRPTPVPFHHKSIVYYAATKDL